MPKWEWDSERCVSLRSGSLAVVSLTLLLVSGCGGRSHRVETDAASPGAAGTLNAGPSSGGTSTAGGRAGANGTTGGGAAAAGAPPVGSGGSGCDPGRISCSDGCVDALTDPMNCGRCDAVCTHGAACAEGACQLLECEQTVMRQSLPTLETGGDPADVTISDWNGDGIGDIATAARDSYAVSVFLGIGDGTFEQRLDSGVASSPEAIEHGDWNADGKQDIATVSPSSSSMSLLLGNGDGTFTPGVDYETGTTPQGLVLGDFNGDGRDDLITPNGDANSISVFLATAQQTLVRTDYPVGDHPHSLVTGDFDGDSRTDLAMLAYAVDSNLAVLLGNGDGTFPRSLSTSVSTYGLVSLATGDLNGDGMLDLGFAEQGGRGWSGAVSALVGNGDGTFPSSMGFGEQEPGPLESGDLNKDGTADLVAADGNSVNLFISKPGGEFESRLSFPGMPTAALALGDLNCDGTPDVVSAGYPRTVSVLLSNSAGWLAVQQALETEELSGLFLLRDLNQDGLLDAAVASPETGIAILHGGASGALLYTAAYGTGGLATSIDAGDIDGDGATDLIIANQSSRSVFLLLAQLDGTYIGQDYPVGMSTSVVRVADVNGDGRLDLVTSGTSEVQVRLDFGGTATTTNYSIPAEPEWLSLVDTNADGLLDIVVAGVDQSVSVLRGLAGGEFESPRVSRTGNRKHFEAFADLNRDGRLDLAVSEGIGGTIAVALGREDGLFEAGTEYSLSGGPERVAFGDVNGDGNPDLVALTYDKAFNLLSGSGDGTFSCAQVYAAPPGTLRFALGDVDRDGDLDTVVTTLNSVNVLLNQSVSTTACASRTSARLRSEAPSVRRSPFGYALGNDLDPQTRYYRIAKELAQQGEQKHAIEHFQKALELDPAHELSQRGWGLALEQQGKLELALVHLLEAVAIHPEYREALDDAARLAARLGRNAEAARLRERASVADPRTPRRFLYWARYLHTHGRDDAALAELTHALRELPGDAEALALARTLGAPTAEPSP